MSTMCQEYWALELPFKKGKPTLKCHVFSATQIPPHVRFVGMDRQIE